MLSHHAISANFVAHFHKDMMSYFSTLFQGFCDMIHTHHVPRMCTHGVTHPSCQPIIGVCVFCPNTGYRARVWWYWGGCSWGAGEEKVPGRMWSGGDAAPGCRAPTSTSIASFPSSSWPGIPLLRLLQGGRRLDEPSGLEKGCEGPSLPSITPRQLCHRTKKNKKKTYSAVVIRRCCSTTDGLPWWSILQCLSLVYSVRNKGAVLESKTHGSHSVCIYMYWERLARLAGRRKRNCGKIVERGEWAGHGGLVSMCDQKVGLRAWWRISERQL